MDVPPGEISKAVSSVAEAVTLSLQTLRDVFGVDAKITVRNAKAKAEAMKIESVTKMQIDGAELLHGYLLKQFGDHLYHQKNIDAVLQMAAPLMLAGGSAENLSEGFRHRFTDAVQDATEEEMRELWARILAQEAKQPNSVSRRAIETMKSLSKDDALLIIKFAPYVLTIWQHSLAMNITKHKKGDGTQKYNLTLEDVLKLDDIGLVKYQELQLELQPKGPLIINYGVVTLLGTIGENLAAIPAIPLTDTGKEIFKVIETEKNYDYLQEVVTNLESQNVILFEPEPFKTGKIKFKPREQQTSTAPAPDAVSVSTLPS